MKIKEVKEPLVFIALKRISEYLINNIWTIVLSSADEIDAELSLAVVQSKRYKKEILNFVKIDENLNWGDQKVQMSKSSFGISHKGDFNPWYDGDLTLEAFLDSIFSIAEFTNSGDNRIEDVEFIHYYQLLEGMTDKDQGQIKIVEKDNIFEKIEEIKIVMVNVSTGSSTIQENNDEYITIYKEINESLYELSIKNPNRFSDLWEFYAYWKKNLKSYAERRVYVSRIYKDIDLKIRNKNKNPGLKLKSNTNSYVNEERIKQLKSIKNIKFDLTRLLKLCDELNLAFLNSSFFSIVMIVRSILDHVPPIFGMKNFSEVTNNYGARSFKESISHLDKSCRKIADAYLHTQIRNKEVLPNSTQIDFSNDLDLLLAEIYRILK